MALLMLFFAVLRDCVSGVSAHEGEKEKQKHTDAFP